MARIQVRCGYVLVVAANRTQRSCGTPMSQTNTGPELCNLCAAEIAPRTGTIRFYRGAAKRHAPSQAHYTASGKTLTLITCPDCTTNGAKRK